MFAILVPASLLPLIVTLLWAERKAKKLGIIMASRKGDALENVQKLTLFQRTLRVASKIDVPGLVLIGTSVALILLPLTLSKSAKGGWNNGMVLSHLPAHVSGTHLY